MSFKIADIHSIKHFNFWSLLDSATYPLPLKWNRKTAQDNESFEHFSRNWCQGCSSEETFTLRIIFQPCSRSLHREQWGVSKHVAAHWTFVLGLIIIFITASLEYPEHSKEENQSLCGNHCEEHIEMTANFIQQPKHIYSQLVLQLFFFFAPCFFNFALKVCWLQPYVCNFLLRLNLQTITACYDQDSCATSVLLSSLELVIQMQIQVKSFLALQLKCAATGIVHLLATVSSSPVGVEDFVPPLTFPLMVKKPWQQ